MNASQIHLALNHVPLFFSINGGLILLFGLFRKNESIKILSLYFLIAAAVFTVPVYLTGEGTEEIVEEIPGVSENLIGRHETMANIGLIVILFTGVAALVALIFRKRTSLLKFALTACVILSFASFGIMAQTAHLGGQIRHSEIRGGMAISNTNETNEKEKGEKSSGTDKEKDD
jgi:uncharacterized membrane protein